VFVFGEYSLATEAIVSKDHQTISDHLAYPLLTFVVCDHEKCQKAFSDVNNLKIVIRAVSNSFLVIEYHFVE
jgi:hypothetical protein